MSKAAGGYELKNRHVRAVIDENSGDLISWGSADGSTDVLHHSPIGVWLENIGPAHASGYVEKRDDQTWQFMGEDAAAGIGWRRIYCLEGDRLYVTYLIQNLQKVPLTTVLALTPPQPPAFSAGDHDWSADAFDATTLTEPFIGAHFRAYNEHHNVTYAAFFPAGLQPTPLASAIPFLFSDRHTLKPGERISWTMQWWLSR